MISVIVPTRNPNPGRLQATLDGLLVQTLPRERWELLVVDNGSTPPLSAVEPRLQELQAKVIVEPQAGLTRARVAGIRAARGDILVFVDDDNILAADYLASVVRCFAECPNLAAAGGPVVPRWESPPPEWTREFHGLLALRDLGDQREIARGDPAARWPRFAPVGAGLAIRRVDALRYVAAIAAHPVRVALDRNNTHLGSGGDNDLVFTALHGGGDVGYFPELRVTHLIPAQRLTCDYLARLNEGIMKTWVMVLHLHGQCPWHPIAPASLPLRLARAWWRFQPWRSAAHRVRWRGAVGQLRGQAEVFRLPALATPP